MQFNKNKLKITNNGSLYSLFRYVPGLEKFSMSIKAGASALIILVCLFLLIPKGAPANVQILKEMLNYSPAMEAEKYYKVQGPKAAYDFATFYQSLPGVAPNKALEKVKAAAEKERSSWSYMGMEALKGIAGLEHHENYAKSLSKVTSAIPFGQSLQDTAKYGNEVMKEIQNFKSGKVDPLHLGLMSLGLVGSAINLLPGDNEQVKSLVRKVNSLLDSVAYMSNNLKSSVIKIFDPIFAQLQASRLLETGDGMEMVKFIESKKDQFLGMLDEAQGSLDNFRQFVTLRNKDFAPVIASSATNVQELDQYAQIATEVGKLNPNFVIYGGESALAAAEKLKAEGRLNAQTLEFAMRYGPAGFKAVTEMPVPELEEEINSLKNHASASRFRLPVIVILVIILAAALVLFKTWIYPRLQNA